MANVKLLIVGTILMVHCATFTFGEAIKNRFVIDRGNGAIPVDLGPVPLGTNNAEPEETEELSVDGVPLSSIPAEFHTLLLEWTLKSTLEDADLTAHFTCSTQSCMDQIEEYEKWRNEHQYGKSSIRW